MRVRNKNTRITLQSATIARSSTGQEVKTWATYAEVMGNLVGLRGVNYYAAEQTANEIFAELYIWLRSDVEPEHRALIDGTTYEVAAPPLNVGMENRELLLRLRVVE